MTTERIESSALRSMADAYQLWNRCGLFLDQYDSPREMGWRKYFEEKPGNFLACYDGERLIATCVMLDDGRKITIQRLAVESEYQRRGIAKTLLDAVEKEATNRGLNGVCALIEDTNEKSRTLALKAGFEEKPSARYFTKSIYR